MLVSVMAFVLAVIKMVEVKDLFSFWEIIGGSYILGNVASKFADKNSAN